MSEPASDLIVDSRLGPLRPNLPPPPVTGQVVGDYCLLEPIGAGGFSMVWKAQHRETREIVAVKLPRVPEFVAHLCREALVSLRFQDPQVVGILEVKLDHDPPFLVSPYVPGSDLALPEEPATTDEIVLALSRFRKILEVVARLHDAGIVHGDLKPGNIRFDPEGVCHLLDLGLARHQIAVRQTTTLRASLVSVTGQKIAGTLEFMAPELMSGEKPGKEADVYALGVLLHSLLCGRPPAFGVSPGELNPFLTPGTADFLRQSLALDPTRRFPDARSLLEPVDGFIRAEERCLRRRNGHARRVVFQNRMKTLGRGIKALGVVGTLCLAGAFGLPFLKRIQLDDPAYLGVVIFGFLIGGLGFGTVALTLGVTTINAWILGIPEKTYKKRSGHPWWTFMMQ